MSKRVRVGKTSMLAKDIWSKRPYIAKDGHAYVNVYNGEGARTDIKNYHPVEVENATLRYDEWRLLDDVVGQVARTRLTGFDDLRTYGLVKPVANPMATTVLTWENISDGQEAHVAINPVSRGNNDELDHETLHIPLPIVYADYQINERLLQESRNRGDGIDVVNAEAAADKVARKLESFLFGSTSPLTYGGGTIYTYITHPDNNDVTLSANWDASGKTAAQILADVQNMKQASINDKHYGPWVLYIPTAYETVIDEDYSTSGMSTQTIRERILKIDKILDVKVVDSLAANNVLLVQMTRDVVDLVDGFAMMNLEWDSHGGLEHNYKVMACQVPRVKSDYNNTSGIVLLS